MNNVSVDAFAARTFLDRPRAMESCAILSQSFVFTV